MSAGDRLRLALEGTNVAVVVDASGCIVLDTPGGRYTVPDIDRLKDRLDSARLFVRQVEHDDHERRRQWAADYDRRRRSP